MARSYDKLKKLMIDKKITNTQLRQATKITTNAMAKIWRDEPVSIEILEKSDKLLLFALVYILL